MNKTIQIREIQHLVDTLHHCTALAVLGFTSHDNLIHAMGVDEQQSNTLTCRARPATAKWKDAAHYPLLWIPDWGQFVGVSVCRHCLDKGYILFGPFEDTCADVGAGRPAEIVPYLIRLVRCIQDRTLTQCGSADRQILQVCCLHVRRALDHIQRHFTEPLTLRAVAAELGVNSTYLSSRFRAQTGWTFCHWLNHTRIQRSQEYLKHTDKPIAAIAAEVGYTSQSYYTSVFSKHVGETPKGYRQRWLSEQHHGHEPQAVDLPTSRRDVR